MLGVALLFNWQLTGIFLIGVPIIGIVLHRFGRTIRRATKRALGQMGKMLAALQEALQALAVVKVHQAEGYERRRFNRINRAVYKQEMKARVARAMSSPVVESIAMIGFMTVALVAAYFAFELGKAKPKDIVFVLGMLGAAGAAFRPLANLNSDLQTSAAAAERLHDALCMEVEPNTRRHPALHTARALPRHCNSVVFENVSFRFPEAARDALQNVNLTVPHGSVCAVVGSNGAGKSTLLNLVPRLYTPAKGRVLIDGVDIADCSLRSLRRQMAMVTQQTVLFEGTIADNITYGSRTASMDRIIAAARQAHAHEFITELPEGYDSPLGEWGSRLSGGQRQRIAIARAILRDPAILILDEATSQIDSDSEAKIAAALAEFEHGRTTFVIAHRLSTVVGADMIVVMEDGRIAAVGKHEQLLDESPAYRVLCQTQLAGPPA
jgi:subfamily B ATP-binding cassette protein MsbA